MSLGFVVNNVVSTLIAVAILNPFLNPMFDGAVRTQEQGLAFPYLLSGYFLLTLIMTIGFPYFNMSGGWVKKGVAWGAIVGVPTFLSGHLIIAGWSVIPGVPMLISGVLDCIAPIATGLVISYFYRYE